MLTKAWRVTYMKAEKELGFVVLVGFVYVPTSLPPSGNFCRTHQNTLTTTWHGYKKGTYRTKLLVIS